MDSLESRKPYAILVEDRAQADPRRPYSLIPRTQDLKDGYTTLTYQMLATAVDKASWWLDQQLGKPRNFETFAYIGANDHRYTILCLASCKTKRQILLPLSSNSREAQFNLLKATDSQALVASEDMVQHWHALQPEVDNLKILTIPSLEYFLNDEGVEWYPYSSTWDEIKDDPILALHTSGSTGLPKPVKFTHYMMSIFIAHGTIRDHFRNKRFITPLPPSWSLGLFLYLNCPLDYGMIPITIPTSAAQPLTAAYMDAVHLAVPTANGGVYIPNVLSELAKNPTYISNMQHIKTVAFGGAPLAQETGNLFVDQGAMIVPLMGATDAGAYGMNISADAKEWMHYNFDDGFGLRFIPFQDELYESVIVRHADPEKARKQVVFFIHPDVEEYHTKDVWKKNPAGEGWLFSGRTDDFVKLASLTKFSATHVEGKLMSVEGVTGVIMGGDGRDLPFLLVEMGEAGVAGELWKLVDEINEKVARDIRVESEMVLFTKREKAMVRVGNKQTVNRRKTLELYAEEIDELYRAQKNRLRKIE